MKNIRAKSIYAIKWNSINQASSVLLRFAISVVLARLLNPKDFGLVAMIFVITDLSFIFINSGFNNALIQKKSLSQEDYSSVFYFNVALGAFFTILVWYSGTLLAFFYGEHLLETLTRTVSIVYLIDALAIVQRSHLTRELSFKKLSIVEISGILCSGVVGIGMALYGYGVWSLVWSHIVGSIIITILFWAVSSWRPQLIFRLASIKSLWGYSYNILGGNVLNHLSLKLDVLILGKLFSPELLGLYSKGRANSEIPSNLIAQISSRSFFPILSKLQDDSQQFKQVYLRLLSGIAFISLPLFVFLIFAAENIIAIVFGSKWLGMVPYFQLFCIAAILQVLDLLKIYSINAFGYPQYNLKLAAIVSPIRLLILLCVAFFWPEIEAYIYVWIIIFFMIANYVWRSFYLFKLISLNFKEEFQYFYKEAAISAVLGLSCYFTMTMLEVNMYADFIISSAWYFTMYFLFSYFQNCYGIKFITDLIKKKIPIKESQVEHLY